MSNMLSAMTAEELGSVMAFLRPVSFPDGAVLFHRGEPPDGFFLIQQGQVALTAQVAGGAETLAEVAGPGDLIGEFVLVSQAPRTQTATARGAVTALFAENKDIEILRSFRNPLHAKILYRLSTSLARRLTSYWQRAEADSEPGHADAIPRVPLGATEQPGCRFDVMPFCAVLPFFREFSQSDIQALLAVSKVWELPRGRWLHIAGDDADAALITIRGAVETRLPRLPESARIALWGPGRLVDSVELLLGGTWLADCRVREPAVVLTLPIPTFHKLLAQGRPVAFKVLGAATRELLERLARAARLMAAREMAKQLNIWRPSKEQA
jgi:CRP-like cAMP-binding protein